MNKNEELPTKNDDEFISIMNKSIKIAVKILAVLMVFVIFWGVADVFYVLYHQLMHPPFMLLNISDIFKTFAAFLAVLIAIEIYQNIILYIRTDVISIKLVIATALTAIARKVIILEFDEISAMYVLSIGAVIIALGITYFLLSKNYKDEKAY